MTVTLVDLDDLKAEVKAAWAELEAPPVQDMAIMNWEYGEDAVHTFVGVRPVDVDINSAGFMAATPLLDLPAHAAAAYLGPYLTSLLEGIQIEEAVGFPIDIKTRTHTIFAMASPSFWTDIASPHLSDTCVSVLGKVAHFIIEHGDVFLFSEEEARGLERLLRSVDRRLNPSWTR
ncbi:hypothetical protein RBU55_13115 [Pseudomonas chlororaphis subsp. aurantiaca]|uniref:hypothetical protein n=1 Tax=Pseudomonas chlororaphis TaxID=587753 RepID=UPI0027DB3A76|nr:hypothetical protein [Pseudomonas chlororaphis]WMJ02459.1 hypothetical protein RBU55_13115 [Pseudomonas chlororaphis subsp. aurantiaca]